MKLKTVKKQIKRLQRELQIKYNRDYQIMTKKGLPDNDPHWFMLEDYYNDENIEILYKVLPTLDAMRVEKYAATGLISITANKELISTCARLIFN